MMGASALVAGRYRLEERLARGGMGAVWRGVDTTLGRPVAVKVLAIEDDPDLTERFRLEARAAARLNHPNLVAAYDFGAHDGRPYLVMELVDGHSLSEELAGYGPLDPDRAAGIAAQTARGLAAAHGQSVVHRDIKPGNLMLAADGTVKIADFGIARLIDEASPALTATGHVMGSSAYLAPERALGAPAVPASDVYSLGCVLYEMLTGRPPFGGGTAAAVAHQHVQATPVPPGRLRPGIPAALADLLPHLMAKDPAARPTAQELATRLEEPATSSGPAASTGRAVVAGGPAASPPRLPDDPAPTAVMPVQPLLLPPVSPPVLPPASSASAVSSPVPPLAPVPDGSAPNRRTAGRGPARGRGPRVSRRTVLVVAAGAAAFTVAAVVAATAGSHGGASSPTPAPATPVLTASSSATAAARPASGPAASAHPAPPPPVKGPHHGKDSGPAHGPGPGAGPKGHHG
ncbi:serine/threonine-protein kinase [Streptomyces sp. HPF1205]|uniref:serine/threonine-protein kinase n=1 Tax=Streptomyces sp. HPF1205 TaxID=2873262 RepID=UPI001CEC102D|nr:serine/threonine-protein kinase [Streptomyces sp. HPF1205]